MPSKQKLLVHYCPYCGGKDIKELTTAIAPDVDSTVAFCLTCDETFNVERDMTDEGDECQE